MSLSVHENICRSRIIYCIVAVVVVVAGCAMTAFAWHPSNLPPPTQKLAVVEKSVLDWLSVKFRLKDSDRALFVRMAIYCEPQKCNRVLAAYGWQYQVSTNDISPKWYLDDADVKTQGISSLCSVDNEGRIVLERQRY